MLGFVLLFNVRIAERSLTLFAVSPSEVRPYGAPTDKIRQHKDWLSAE